MSLDSKFLSYFFSQTAIASPCWKYGLVDRSSSLEELWEVVNKLFGKDELARLAKIAELAREKSEKEKVYSIDYYNPDYPNLLKEIYHPPLVLYYRGNLSVLQKNLLAVVGTRNPSPVAIAACDALPQYLSHSRDSGVVSGLAVGIDRRAMEACLQSNQPVVGVMGTGFDKSYPVCNRDLYEAMTTHPNALILTEMYWGETVGKWSFPRRNRIITGLSKTVFIMESPLDSGAMSSASHAISQNREIIVFDDPSLLKNEGGRKLISEGAQSISLKDLTGAGNQIVHVSELFPFQYQKMGEYLGFISRLELEGLLIDRGGGYYEFKNKEQAFSTNSLLFPSEN